ncbi:four and a half LIM domains protein 5-like [Zophobas morio]|uniref:four and a half LIM domains protein 5-like n=1 Tax=Zophobas morio TaxID=2755281 RepID=UPI003083BCDF
MLFLIPFHADCVACHECTRKIIPGEPAIQTAETSEHFLFLCPDCDCELTCSGCREVISRTYHNYTKTDNLYYHNRCLSCSSCGVLCTNISTQEWPFHCIECKKTLETVNTTFQPDCPSLCTDSPVSIEPLLGGHSAYKSALSELVHVSTEKCKSCLLPTSGTKYVRQEDGNTWHEECFHCAKCACFVSGKFITAGRFVYCFHCYSTLFLPKCSLCSDEIKAERYVTVKGKEYHARCLSCAVCKSHFFFHQNFHLVDGRNYCKQCSPNS